MHYYLRSIGFGNVQTVEDQDLLIADVLKNYDFKKVIENEEHQMFAQYSKEYAPDVGVTVCGYYDDENFFHMEYYYPYMIGSQTSACSNVAVERSAAVESYNGAFEDSRVGTTLIFQVLNAGDYVNDRQRKEAFDNARPVALSGLAESGTILLPIKKNEDQLKDEEKKQQKRNSLYNAAARGDEKAMNSLTIEDFDAYTTVARRIKNEDIYSIVDSYIMPYGLECNLYNIMGQIIDYSKDRNAATNEPIVRLTVEANGIPMDICIHGDDLTGEPGIGRRFKSVVWLEGMVNF
jgi:hypothetical protein